MCGDRQRTLVADLEERDVAEAVADPVLPVPGAPLRGRLRPRPQLQGEAGGARKGGKDAQCGQTR